MHVFNLTPRAKVGKYVAADPASFNGCSGYMWVFASVPKPESQFIPISNSHPLSLIKGAGPYDISSPYCNRRLGIILPTPDMPMTHAIINKQIVTENDFLVYRLLRGGKVAAVMATAEPARFDDPKSPPAWYLADPSAHLSMQHFADVGYLHGPDSAVVPKQAKVRAQGSRGAILLAADGPTAYGVRDPLNHWSQERPWLCALPWWESNRIRGINPPSQEDIVNCVSDHVLGRPADNTIFNGLRWVAGNAVADSAYDSFRAVFCFYALDQERAKDPTAEQYIDRPNGRVYYKVLPFYFHSPQHQDHRVAAVFLSREPLTLDIVRP